MPRSHPSTLLRSARSALRTEGEMTTMPRDKNCPSCGESPTDEPGEDCEHDDFHYDPSEDDERVYDNLDDPMFDDIRFADPGGRSALRAASESNPRNLPCGNCGSPNRLTPEDKALGYQCDSCADRAEGIYTGGDY